MLAAALFFAAAAAPHLTPDGWGRAKIGMTRAEVEKALHVRLKGEPIEDEKTCIEMVPVGPDRGIGFLFENYRLTRISVGAPSRVTTPRGVGIGATAAQIRRSYPQGLEAEKNYYEDPPAEYLTLWTVPKRRGVRFETGKDRRVYVMHAGGESITYVEGCA